MNPATTNRQEKRERAESIADVLAVIGFVFCVALGGIPGVLLFGPPGLVVGALILAPFSLLIAGWINKLPFMRDVY